MVLHFQTFMMENVETTAVLPLINELYIVIKEIDIEDDIILLGQSRYDEEESA